MPSSTKCRLGHHRLSARTLRISGSSWLCQCRSCEAELHYISKNGWIIVETLDYFRMKSLLRRLMQATALGLALYPLSSAANYADAGPSNAIVEVIPQSSLSQVFAQQRRKNGLHCRSAVDGSNSDAVAQVLSSGVNPMAFKHIETIVRPAREGFHEFVMVFTMPDQNGQKMLRRVSGTINQDDCAAYLERAF